jgi:hypothetical protein
MKYFDAFVVLQLMRILATPSNTRTDPMISIVEGISPKKII